MRLDPILIARDIDNLLAAYPELQDDEELRADIIAGETNAFETLSVLVRRIGETDATADGLGTYITELGQRKARLKRRIESYRKLIVIIMDHAKLTKRELPEATVSLRPGKDKLVIIDDNAVPEALCVISYSPDRVAITEAIEAGADVEWAAMVQSDRVLTIRTK